MGGVRLWIVLTLAIAVFFGRLDAGLLEPQEPRYAEVARQMTLASSWVVPLLDDQPYLDKPPLFYWALMTSYRFFGIHDWAARIVPAVSGVLVVITVFFWGYSLFGQQSGFWGAIVLCLSARFVYLERILTFDGLLCFWVTLAIATGERALRALPPHPFQLADQNGTENQSLILHPDATRRIHRGWWVLSAMACGMGILTKGPVALVLVIPPLLYLHRHLFAFVTYSVVASLVAVPWFVAVILREPEFASYFFWRHNVVRFLAPFDHAEPWWFHLPGLLLGMCPWILLFPRIFRQSSARFLVLAAGWSLLFFSLAGCKRAVYILPALPPLALALGHQIALIKGPSLLSVWGSSMVLFLALAIASLAGWNQLLPWSVVGLAITGSLQGLIFVLRDPRPSWNKTAIITALVLIPAIQLLLPSYNRQFAIGEKLLHHQKHIGDKPLVILCYPQSWESVHFYTPQARVMNFNSEHSSEFLRAIETNPNALILIRSGRWTKILDDLPADLRYVGYERPGAVWAGRVEKILIQHKDDRGTNLVTQGDTPGRLNELSGSN